MKSRNKLLSGIVLLLSVVVVAACVLLADNNKVNATTAPNISREEVYYYQADEPTPTPKHGHYFQINDVIGVICDDGYCGDNLEWSLDDDGTLTIWGSGDMYDFALLDVGYDSSSPWHSKNVKSVIIEEGVTSIGNYSFLKMSTIESILIPSSVNNIGERAFHGCTSFVIKNNGNIIHSLMRNLRASPYSYKSIKLSWDKMENAVGYSIYQTNVETMEYWGWSERQIKYVDDVDNCIVDSQGGIFRIAPIVQINGMNVELSPFCWAAGNPVDTSSSANGVAKGNELSINGVKVKTLDVAVPGVIEIDVELCDTGSRIEKVYVNVCDTDFESKEVDFSVNQNGILTMYYLIKEAYNDYISICDLYFVDSYGNMIGINPYYDDYNSRKVHIYKEFDIEFQGVLSNPYVANELANMDEGKTVVLKIDEESNGILKKECLDAIKGQDKTIVVYCNEEASMQWVFYGKDIKGTTKDLDVRVSIAEADASRFGGTGIMPEILFADNGTLPGWINFRFKSTYVKTQLKLTDNLYLYYFSQGKVSLEDTECQLLRGGDQYWCYVPINHNSTYYLSGQKLNNDIKNKEITLSSNIFVCDGTVKNPEVTVKSGSAILKKDVDYTVSYSSGRKTTGKYTVTVKGKGSFTGAQTLSFEIVAATPTPTSKPTNTPTAKPTVVPTIEPTTKPTTTPTSKPSSKPTTTPTSKPATNVTINLNKSSANVTCGDKLILKVTVKGSSNEVKWTSSNSKIASVDKNGKITTKMAGTVTITATVAGESAKCKVTVLYKDVTSTKDFWYKPTNYLTEAGVVKGYDKQTLFKPANDCTRAQMLTFMWRLSGEPTPKAKICKFPDVKKGDYFYKPVIWAVEQGITTGYKDGKFKPKNVCTRAQTVTFLWRMAGKPAPNTKKNMFSDVKKSDYFYKATLWASGEKILAGYSDGTFKPQGKCLRRQMVTFLYKYDKYVNGKG